VLEVTVLDPDLDHTMKAIVERLNLVAGSAMNGREKKDGQYRAGCQVQEK
jgi:hypothetical protein